MQMILRSLSIMLLLASLLLLDIPKTVAAPPSCNAAAEGTIVYNVAHKLVQFCNGTQWVGLVAKIGGAGDTLSDLSCASGQTVQWSGSAWTCAAASSSVWLNGGAGKIYYNGGNVGIGIQTPLTSLHVQNAGPSGKTFSQNVGLIIENNGIQNNWFAMQVSTAGANDAFSITNAGNVGIGTNDPLTPLDVSGTIRTSGALSLSADLSSFGNSADEQVLNFMPTMLSSDGSGGYKLSWRNADDSPRIDTILLHKTGNVGIKSNAVTALTVGGTLKIGNGAELCNTVAHEGAMRYVASTDTFEMCRSSATGWEAIGTGSGALPALTSANIWVGNGSNAATAVAMSGDATLSNAGVLTIANNAIGSAEITDASIGLADLSATGTKSATTFLRGDNTWAAPTAGDAATVDGLDSAQFLRSDAADTASGQITFTQPLVANNTFAIDGSGPGAQQNGLYVADLGGTQGATLNPTYTAAIVGQSNTARSIALSVDSGGYLWGFRSHSNAGTYTFQSKIKSADDAGTLGGQNSAFYRNASNLNAGTVPTARLGTGTANSSVFLRGDGTWAAPPSGADNLGNHTATQALDMSGNAVTASGGVVMSAASANQARLKHGNFGVILRNDGTNYYHLLTNSGDADGTWNALRPLTINLSTGAVSMANGLTVAGTASATSFSGSGASLTALNATNLGSGTVPAARMPALTGDVTMTAGTTATNIAAGVVGSTEITDLGVANADIANATIVATAKLSATGTKDATTFLRGDNTWASVPSGADNLGNHIATTVLRSDTHNTDDLGTTAIRWKDGWFAGTVTGTTFSGSGASLTALNATNLASGTVPAARLPAYTGDVTKAAGGTTLTIGANAVTSAEIADGTIANADIASATITAAKTSFVGTLTEGKWCTVSGGKIVCTQDAPSGGGTISCPSGFTKMEAAGNVLGCIHSSFQTAQTHANALTTCFNSFGGRLPTYAERKIAQSVYGLGFAGLFQPGSSEWIADIEGADCKIMGASGPSGGGYSCTSTSEEFRCFIPRPVN